MTQLTNLLKGKVALLYGGSSSEREVSLKSGAAVLAAFKALNIEVVGIDCHFEQLAEQLKAHDIRHVFNILHGGYGENGQLQALLESMGITYTGSGVLACALAMDKYRSKLLWRGAGLPTADFVLLQPESQWQDVAAKLGNKMMIKPANEGSSIGMAVAENAQEFEQALAEAFRYDKVVIAEKWLAGAEFTVAILADKALPLIRLETDSRFYDYQAKYLSNDTRYICPCGLPVEVEQQVQTIALQAFEVLGCIGWGRIDVMQDNKGDFYLLEANTVPGMTDHSLVPMAAKAFGLNFDDLVAEIFKHSLR